MVVVPWKLISDGDLWQHFYIAVQAKGTRAIKITWVKGHATEEHINKGITDERNKQGNDVADKCADIGATLHGDDLLKLSKIMHKRHNKYFNFMKNVSHHIIEAYMIHRRLLELHSKQQPTGDDANRAKIVYTPLKYVKEDGGSDLPILSTIAHFRGHVGKHAKACHAEHFLRNLKVQRCDDGPRPVTWLELYILYRLRGHPKPIDDPSNKAEARATPAKQINAFKQSVRAVAHRTFNPKEYSLFLGSARIKKPNLSEVAIAGKHACLPFNVAISHEEQVQIAQQLVKLTHSICMKK